MLASTQTPAPETDRGPSAAGGERSCALTRIVKSTDDMIRFVVGPDGAVVPDIKRKLPGRGVWITATREALEEAVGKRIFARSFKHDVRVANDLPFLTEQLLAQAALDALAMAGKAGNVAAGFGKTEDALNSNEAVAVIHASDAAADGRRKLEAVLRRNGRQIPVVDAFLSAQLDLALNRLNVIHAALLAGPVSDTFLARTERFARFRTGFPPKEAQDHAVKTAND
jgi:uncharacterized protein